MKITINDVRQANICVDGLKQFCNDHGIDLRELIKHGIDETRLLATGDAMARRVVETARGNHGRK